MLNFINKFILTIVGLIAFAAIIALVIYKIAVIIAVMVVLLGIGFIIGVPSILVYKMNNKKLKKQYATNGGTWK